MKEWVDYYSSESVAKNIVLFRTYNAYSLPFCLNSLRWFYPSYLSWDINLSRLV